MADKLEYESRFAEKGPRPAIAPPRPQVPLEAVPDEFDEIITTSSDHPAVQAIEAALGRAGIAVFRSEEGDVVGRQVSLLCRGVDAVAARVLAAEVFARRAKIKAYPRPEMPVDRDLPTESG